MVKLVYDELYHKMCPHDVCTPLDTQSKIQEDHQKKKVHLNKTNNETNHKRNLIFNSFFAFERRRNEKKKNVLII